MNYQDKTTEEIIDELGKDFDYYKKHKLAINQIYIREKFRIEAIQKQHDKKLREQKEEIDNLKEQISYMEIRINNL